MAKIERAKFAPCEAEFAGNSRPTDNNTTNSRIPLQMTQVGIRAKTRVWLTALRLNSLPLAIASIAMGAFLAAANDMFDSRITALAMLTAALLQSLSNLANDYGDSIHGADALDPKTFDRPLQAGLVSLADMRRAMFITAILAIFSGISLLWIALGSQRLLQLGLFILLGGAALWAAIRYTAGDKPYGYSGFGDLSVFLFFGLSGVLGTYFLEVGTFNGYIVLPAVSVGTLTVAVLNINNIRDISSDAKAGKRTLPVLLGLANARRYHWCLLCAAPLTALAYVILQWQSVWQLLFLVTVPLLIINARAVAAQPREQLDTWLQQMVVTALLFVLTFGLGQLF